MITGILEKEKKSIPVEHLTVLGPPKQPSEKEQSQPTKNQR